MIRFLSITTFSKSCVLSLIFLALSLNSFSQQKTGYSLLWEISGNGLKKSSYLFGTMHVKDRRVFNFSDSVMKAIEASSAYVMEIHPDSIHKAFFDNGIQMKKDFLNKEQREKVMKRFEKRNGYTPDSSILNNPILVKSLMKTDHSKEDDMQTFVDGYLYGIARTMKKKVFGLEETEDQVDVIFGKDGNKVLDLFDIDEEEELENIENLIELYSRGSLDEIWDVFKRYEISEKSIARNNTMFRGIKGLLKDETLFAAVGVAHLPGKRGLIALLRKAGYNLRPVEATFTGVAETYQIDHSKIDWYNYRDSVDNYSIEFPSLPFEVERNDGKRLMFFSDIMNETIYTSTSFFTGPISSDSYLDTLVSTFLSEGISELLSKKTVDRNGLIGHELVIKRNNIFSRRFIALKNNHFYELSVESKKNNLDKYFVERFFNSLDIVEPDIVKAKDWINYTHDKGAFSINFPTNPQEIINEIPNPDNQGHSPYLLNIYFSSDKANLVSYLIRYNDFPIGMYLSDKKLALDGIIDEFVNNGEVVNESRVIFKDGFEGRAVDVIFQGSYTEVQTYVRGNRVYLVLRQNLKGPEAIVDNNNFFDSFRFEEYSHTEGVPFSERGSNVIIPEEPILISEEEADESTSFLKESKLYFAINRNTGGVYGFESSLLSKYFRIADADSLYNNLYESFKSSTDSLHSSKSTMIGKTQAVDYHFTDSLSGNHKRLRIWLHGDKVYSQRIISSKEEVLSEQANDFFDSVKLDNNQMAADLESSKAALITQDLRSKDSVVFNNALGAMYYYEFEKEELPFIYDALSFKYADDTLSTGTRSFLIRILTALNDEHTVKVLKDLYRDSDSLNIIRASILSAVPEIDSTSYDWYLNTLIESPIIKTQNYWSLFSPLSDSLSYVAEHLDQLLPLLSSKEYRPGLLSILSNMLNGINKEKYHKLIESKKEMISANAIEDLNDFIINLENQDGTGYSAVYSYLTLLPQINQLSLTDEFTNKLFAVDSIPYFHTSALAARIQANLAVDQGMLESQLDSLKTRYEILYAFYHSGKLDDVDSKYRKHDEFAKLNLYTYLANYYDYPLSIKLLGNVRKEDKDYYAFEFSYIEDKIKNDYIGICGPFDSGTEKLNFEEYTSHSKFELLGKDWISQAQELIVEIDK